MAAICPAVWLLSALSLLIVCHVVSGFPGGGLRQALVAALVIGLFDATIGLVLKIVTLPLTIVRVVRGQRRRSFHGRYASPAHRAAVYFSPH